MTKTSLNIEVIDNGYLMEVFIGRSKIGSKFFNQIPHKTVLNRFIENCKREFKELSNDKYCNCGNKLISDEEKRIKVCKECK